MRADHIFVLAILVGVVCLLIWAERSARRHASKAETAAQPASQGSGEVGTDDRPAD